MQALQTLQRDVAAAEQRERASRLPVRGARGRGETCGAAGLDHHLERRKAMLGRRRDLGLADGLDVIDMVPDQRPGEIAELLNLDRIGDAAAWAVDSPMAES
jgi:hypothetical protein